MKKISFSGFTLMELLVVISLMGILTAVGLSAYAQYNKKQGLQVGTADVVNMLATAKSRAISQVKPLECGGNSLSAYIVSVLPSGTAYTLQVVCGGNTMQIMTKSLPHDVTFGSSSQRAISFVISTGTVPNPGKIIVQSGGVQKTIVVTATGAISNN